MINTINMEIKTGDMFMSRDWPEAGTVVVLSVKEKDGKPIIKHARTKDFELFEWKWQTRHDVFMQEIQNGALTRVTGSISANISLV